MNGKIRVLYVDDEPGLLEIGKLFLEDGGEFEVDTLTSAKAALEQLKTGRYDAIVSDYLMPEMDGLEFLKQVRLHHDQVPFILFTGRGREEVVILALNNGADFYLQKGGEPVSQFTELTHKINQSVNRKRSEGALRESEDRFSRAIAGTGAGLWDWDMVSDRVFFSPQWKAMLGYEDHEVENNLSGWKNLWHPDDASRIEKAVSDYLEGKTIKYEIEHRLHHKDGSWHWIMTRGDIHRDAAGRPVRWTGTNIDITEHRHIEEDRENALAMLQCALAQSPSGILIADAPDVKIRWANEAALRIRGGSQLPLTGIDVANHAVMWQTYRSDGTLMPPEELPLSRSILKGETVRNEEVIIRHSSGVDRYVSANSAPIRNAAGVITAGIVVFHDITERKQAEEALRVSEEKFRSLVEYSLDAILVLDLQGTILLANRATLSLVECGEGARLTGRNVMEFIAPESREAVMQAFQQVASGHDAYLAQYTVITGKGNKVTVESIGKVISYEGRPADLVSLRDITERRGAVEAVRQKNLMLTTLNDFQKEFAELPAGKSVEELAVKKLMDLSGAVVTMFSAYDPKEEVLRVSSITYDPGILASLPDAIEMLTRWLGKRPEDMQMPLGQETYRDIKRSVVGVKKTVAELSYGSISPLVSASIQKLSGIDHFIHIAHVIDGELYGISVMGVKSGQPDPSQELLESFAHIVAVSLRRQRAEAGIAESEQLLRDIIDKNPMSIQIVDREGFTLKVNPAFMRLFGSVPPPDFSIISDLVKRHPELETLISRVQSGEAVNLPDMRFNAHDICPELPDVPTRVRAIIFPLNDHFGKPERFVFMHENITGQKLAEEALLGSRRILEAVIDNVPARVFWKDTNLTYLGCNTAFARDAGFEKPGDIIGKDDFSMGWRNQAELYRADDRHVIESGNAKLLIEEPQTTPTGEEISLLTSKVPLRDAAGDIIGVLGTYIDVTERKRAAEELKESEISYRGLFNTIQHALYILDREGKFVDVNSGAEKMYGYAREEFTGRTPEFLSAPGRNDLPAVAEKIQKAFAGEPQEFGFWGLRKNGEVFPKDVFLYRGRYFGEDIILAVGIDTTERMKTQEQIRESEEKYRLLADNLPEYVFIHREGTLLYVNRAVEEVTGMTAAELRRHSVMDFIAPESKALVAEKVRQRILGEQNCRYEAAILVKNAKKLYGLVNSIQIPYNGLPASLVVVTDIDERKAAEQNLKESEERYHNLIDTSHDIIYSLSPEGVLLFVSPAWTHLLGHPVADVSGHIFTEFVHPEDLQACNTFHQKVLETGERQEGVEYRVRHADGQWRWHISNATPLRDAAGSITGFTGIAHDITERKKAEEALRQANRKLNLLSGITRHDIKNQLLSLNGFLQISKKYTGDAAKMAEFIEKEAKIARTMERHIAFTKEYEAIGVKAPVWQECRALVDTAEGHVPHGKCRVQNDLPADREIFADPLIVKVWYNLMDNAVRYGGKITTIRFSVEERGDEHVLLCEDDGGGIPAEDKDLIFERGFGKNTGMGLFLSREILAITGITIRETGEPGKGARFEIMVPKGAWRIIAS